MGLPDGPWTDEDRLLIVAHQIHEDGLCSCGHHRDDAWDLASVGDYKVAMRECQACGESERHDRVHKERKDGEKRFVYNATAYPD